VTKGSDANFTVRSATPEDLEAAMDMFIEVASEGRWIGTELPVDRDDRLRRWLASMEDPKNVFFVAVEGDRVIGNASLQWRGASDLGMAVAADRRGQGVGSALLEACIEWAKDQGIHKMELKVWPHNEAAIALYEKYGFEREGYMKRHYRRRNGEIWDCVLMGLQLPQ
jgi:RimJ/RimL family protein N-acetyltransferase